MNLPYIAAPIFDDIGFTGPWYVHVDDVPPHYCDAIDPDTQGDDRVHRAKTGRGADRVDRTDAEAAATPKPPALVRVVPLHREVKLGTVGPDAVAVKRALSKLGFVRWQTRWTRLFGPLSVRPLKRAQEHFGLPPDGVYGAGTHARFVAHGGFDRYGAWLMGTAPSPLDPKMALRNRIVAQAMWGYHNRDRIHYAQSRPIDGHGVRWKLPLWTDCSGAVTDWYEWAGGHDPNHLGFNGQGYTGTLVDHGLRTGRPLPADLNFYGWDYAVHGPMHVTIQVGLNGDLCVSHGNEAGPSLVPRRYWSAYYETRSYI